MCTASRGGLSSPPNVAGTSRAQRTAEKLSEIDRRKAGKKSGKRSSGFQWARIGALNKVYRHRYHGEFYQFSEDDAGSDDLRILLEHYAYSNPFKIPAIIKMRAPWLSDDERDSLLEQVERFPRIWTSAALAEALRLTEEERIALGGVPAIGAIDVTPEERKQKRKERNTARMREARRAKNVQPRDQYLAKVKSSAKPWEADGVSRATYYRRLKKGVRQGVCAVNLVNAQHTPRLTEQGPMPGHVGAGMDISSGPVPSKAGSVVRLVRSRVGKDWMFAGVDQLLPWNDQPQEKKAA
jgi:hypothetical protein